MNELMKEAVGKMIPNRAVVTTGMVKSVNGNTCTVERQNLPDLLDVRLNAIDADLSNTLFVKPAKGSTVLCVEIDGAKEETSIIKYGEIESVLIEVDGAIVELKAGKITVKNEKANLKSLLTDLLAELENSIIQTPAGPGNFSPNNVTKFQDLKSKTNNLLE